MSRGALRRRGRLLVVLAALAGVAFLAVFPAQATISQRRHRADLAATLAELTAERKVLDDRARVLQSDEEIERLARLEHLLVKPGEEAYAILPEPATTLARPGSGAVDAPR